MVVSAVGSSHCRLAANGPLFGDSDPQLTAVLGQQIVVQETHGIGPDAVYAC
jgi:hypothetical protein